MNDNIETKQKVDFTAIEKKWQKKWEDAKVFEVNEDKKKKKYYALEMYPYPSASGLHIGHTFNYTICDIYSRFKRMSGFNVLYPMGYDSFGLPAENAAIKANSHPKVFTDAAISNFIKQQKSLGLSYDWTRKLQSHDPNYYMWNQFFFLQFLKRGLAYRKKSSVNFCSKCNTVLANEQVHQGKCWRHTDTDVEIRHLEQWFLKTTNYADELLDKAKELDWPNRIKAMQENWIGKSYGTEILFELLSNRERNCVIVHGSNDSEKEALKGKPENLRHWKPWLQKSLEKKGIKASNDLYPKDWAPDYLAWKKVFEKNKVDENTTLVGHSAGCSFILRWLSENKKKVDKVVFVAPSIYKSEKYKKLRFKDFEYDTSLKQYFNELTIIYSDTDDEDIIRSSKEIHFKIDGSLVMLKGKGHFTYEDMGSEEFPELLNSILNGEKWPIFTTRPDTIFGVTFMVVSAQHPKLMELVTKGQKKEVEAFLKKIKSTSEKDSTELEKEGAFTGSYAINPINGDKVPVYTGNFVVADYGSGMVMAVPAHDQRDFEFAKKYKIPIKLVVKPEDYEINSDKMARAFAGEGVLINSSDFNGRPSKEAVDEISNFLERKKLGKKVVQYKLRDWLLSRQRYWGTPIPVIYCDKCGIVPVPEKELPVLLPDKVKFGEGNPLATSKEFVETKCPQCAGKARRETDTMDTFFDSSWYYLRFTDPQNKKEPFDKKKTAYWMPVDFYIGGAEHATMHLIYARFFTKVLRDLGYLKFDEPFKKLFNQGMVHGEDGVVMSKSRGNVIDPLDISSKYGADTLRLFIVSMASPDKDSIWSNTGIESMLRFVNKMYTQLSDVKFGKSSEKIEHKVNKTIKEVTSHIENLEYNIAIIKIRALFDSMEKEMSKGDLQGVVKIIAPFCPHIAEEIWSKLGNREFISIADWPVADEKKINEKFDLADKAIEKSVSDILNVLKIVKEKQGKDAGKVYLYVLPNELENYDSAVLGRRVGKNVQVFAVNDKKKYDPEGKSGKAKPGKPGIYLE